MNTQIVTQFDAEMLVPVYDGEIGDMAVQTVNARELHCFLDVGRDFSNWIKDQIQRARLVEGKHYMTVAKKGDVVIKDLQGLRPGLDYSVDYYLTLDAGKHIGMISGTDKGFEIRDYFIECEKKLNAAKTPGDALVEMAMAYRAHERQIMKLQEEQLELARRQAEVERIQHDTVSQVKALVEGENYFTVVGFANRIGVRVDEVEAARLGKVASKICRDNDIHRGEAPHPRYGTAKTYPIEVLEATFGVNKSVSH